MDFVDAIEDCLGQKAERNYMGMQAGDVPATWANADLLKTLTGYRHRQISATALLNLWTGIESTPGNDS